MAKPDKPDTPMKPDFAKPQTSDLHFSPQKTAALNAQYISVSRKCAEVDEILIKKKNEFLLLGDKIKSLEKAKQQLEYDKKSIMCQISNEAQRYKPLPSPSPVKCKPEKHMQHLMVTHITEGEIQDYVCTKVVFLWKTNT